MQKTELFKLEHGKFYRSRDKRFISYVVIYPDKTTESSRSFIKISKNINKCCVSVSLCDENGKFSREVCDTDLIELCDPQPDYNDFFGLKE